MKLFMSKAQKAKLAAKAADKARAKQELQEIEAWFKLGRKRFETPCPPIESALARMAPIVAEWEHRWATEGWNLGSTPKPTDRPIVSANTYGSVRFKYIFGVMNEEMMRKYREKG